MRGKAAQQWKSLSMSKDKHLILCGASGSTPHNAGSAF